MRDAIINLPERRFIPEVKSTPTYRAKPRVNESGSHAYSVPEKEDQPLFDGLRTNATFVSTAFKQLHSYTPFANTLKATLTPTKYANSCTSEVDRYQVRNT